MKKEHELYFGCIQSKLDGSEYIADVDEKLEIPDEFILNNVMPPVKDQGTT